MRRCGRPAAWVSSEPRTQLAQEAYLFTLTNEPSRAPSRHVRSKQEAGLEVAVVMQGKAKRATQLRAQHQRYA